MAGKGAPEGNQYAEKYDTPLKRKRLLNAYIKHCEAGYPDDMFEECDMRTFKLYVKKYPLELRSDVIDKAKAKRAKLLYDIGIRGTVGLPIKYTDPKTGNIVEAKRGFNAKSWQFIMMNLLHWRQRDDVTSKDKEVKGGFVIYRPEKLPDNYDEKMKPNATSNARTAKAS